MSDRKIIVWAIFGLMLTLMMEQFTNWDILISNHFYDKDISKWMISYQQHLLLSPLFYNGLKAFVSAVGTIAVVCIAASVKYEFLKPYRTGAVVLVLCTIIIPSSVAFLKDVTRIYCPNQLNIYSGLAPYIHVFGSYPDWFQSIHQPRCFPAGHPTGAFALMALSFVFLTPRFRCYGLLFGFLLGCVASGYQMLRGEHFLSHCLVSFFMAVILMICVRKAVLYLQSEFSNRFSGVFAD